MSKRDVTRILGAIENGDAQAASELLPVVYEELRRLAAGKLRREKPQTLQATDLVHEAYLRLVGKDANGGDRADWQGRAHFFSAAAEAMRRILIDRARQRARIKHGGGRERVELEDVGAAIAEPVEDLLTLDEALEKLARDDPGKAELVKLRYFAGLTSEEAARILGISRATAERHFRYARAWLFDEISKGDTAMRDPASRGGDGHE